MHRAQVVFEEEGCLIRIAAALSDLVQQCMLNLCKIILNHKVANYLQAQTCSLKATKYTIEHSTAVYNAYGFTKV